MEIWVSSSSVGPLGQASQGMLGDGYLLLKAKQGKISGVLGSVSGHQPSSGAFHTGCVEREAAPGEEGRSKKAGRKERKSRAEESKWRGKGGEEKGREGGARGGARRG